MSTVDRVHDAALDTRDATARMLWEAARLQPRPEDVRSAIRAADTALTVQLAMAHGLSGMLLRALRAADDQNALGDLGAPLIKEAELRRMEALLLVPHAVQTAITPLTCAGLEPIIFKGPSLASRYPEPGLRSMVDLDVIVPETEHMQAVTALVDAGWSVQDMADTNRYETLLLHPSVPSLFLELHRGLDTWFDRSAEMSMKAIWDRRLPADVMGTSCYGLPREIEFVALVAHAGKPFHAFSRLIWIVDLAVVAADGLDWDEVSRLATKWRCRTMLAVALSQASRIGLSGPPDLLRVSASGLRLAALEPARDVTWPLRGPLMADRTRLRYALADRWTRRIILFLGASATSSIREWFRGYGLDFIRALKWIRSNRRGAAA